MRKTSCLKQAIFKIGFALLSGAIIFQSGCRSARRGEPLVVGSLSKDPALERGRIAFAHHCYMCHPGGEGGLGPALNNKPLPRFLMKTQVRLGLGAMPKFSRHSLPADELDDLMRYVLAQRRLR
jgi:mono/diheme cytochrome c family protein